MTDFLHTTPPQQQRSTTLPLQSTTVGSGQQQDDDAASRSTSAMAAGAGSNVLAAAADGDGIDPRPPPPVTLVIVGAGQRGKVYADYALRYPHLARVAYVCEPNHVRRRMMARKHGLLQEGAAAVEAQARAKGPKQDSQKVFKSWQDLLQVTDRQQQQQQNATLANANGSGATTTARLADAVVIATLDRDHAEAVKEFSRRGYAILCEKPIATSVEECVEIVRAVKQHGVIFGTGHVLRYSPFNQAILAVLRSGVLGQVQTIQHVEPVGAQHFAHSFVRGNWRRKDETTFSLLAKCCHDMDILNFYRQDGASAGPRALSSFGSLTHFKPENKPREAGSAESCMDCAHERSCPYSARKIYLDPLGEPRPEPDVNDPETARDLWAERIVDGPLDVENVTAAIAPGTPWGRCVYAGGNDVNDQQLVNVQYDDGSTASLAMVACTLRICERATRISGSHGELVGDMRTFTVTDFRDMSTVEHRPPDIGRGGHGGGDEGLMRAFVRAVATGRQEELGVTPDDILKSHLMVFAAEQARERDEVVRWKDFQAQVNHA